MIGQNLFGNVIADLPKLFRQSVTPSIIATRKNLPIVARKLARINPFILLHFNRSRVQQCIGSTLQRRSGELPEQISEEMTDNWNVTSIVDDGLSSNTSRIKSSRDGRNSRCIKFLL